MKIFDEIKFDEEGLIPVVIFEEWVGQVLTLCYMNREALQKTIETGRVHVFRRSHGKVMKKGETSGHTQEVKAIHIDCEGNSLLIRVKQHVAGCHKGYMSCYFQRYNPRAGSFEVTEERIFDPEKVHKS